MNEIWKGSSWVNNEFVEWVKAIDQFRLIQKWINVPNKNSLVITHDSYSNLLDGQQLIALISLWSDRLFVSLSAFDIFFKKKDSDVFSCLITSTRYNVITIKYPLLQRSWRKCVYLKVSFPIFVHFPGKSEIHSQSCQCNLVKLFIQCS